MMGHNIIDFQSWKMTVENACRARQASAGVIHESIELRHICRYDDPLYKLECKSQHTRDITIPSQYSINYFFLVIEQRACFSSCLICPT